MTELAVGQRWTYQGETQGADSTVLIGRIDEHPGQSTIVHLSVEDLATPGADETLEIGHMPFTHQAVVASVLSLVETGVDVNAGLDAGIAEWAEAQGGVFTIPIIEAVEVARGAVPEVPQEDVFDDMARAMRERRTQEAVDVLYRELFSLPRWFFMADPHDGQSPVQWIYDGASTDAPAILAFTSHERAVAAATALGIYEHGESVGVMQPTVAEAVDWISSAGFVNEWLSFNESKVSFPLFANEAKPRFEAASRSAD